MKEEFFENFYDSDSDKQGLESYIEDENERIMLKWRAEGRKKDMKGKKSENMR